MVIPSANRVLLDIDPSWNTGLNLASGKASVLFTLLGVPINLSIGLAGFPIIVLGILRLFSFETILSTVSIASREKNGDNMPSAIQAPVKVSLLILFGSLNFDLTWRVVKSVFDTPP